MSQVLYNQLFSVDKSTESVGKKGFYLHQMLDAALEVPPFFILSTKMVQEILLPVWDEIVKLESAAVQNTLTIENCKKLTSKIKNLSIPGQIREGLTYHCRRQFGTDYQLAIRSSATLEDGKSSSFAGQFNTFLHVSDEDLWSSILACIASSWTYEVFAYRKAQGLLEQAVRMAVILQKMIVAERSGVGFSMNVRGNLAESLIIAGYGLGEGIVSDHTETDTIYVNRQNKTIHSSIAPKYRKTVQAVGSVLQFLNLTPEEAQNPVLNNAEILEVHDLILKAEQILGSPTDIEFSFDKDGKLYILQMRPITALNLKELIVLDNTNIIESYPGITLPLSYSFVLKAYETVFRNSASSFWISKKDYNSLDNVFSHLLYHFKGRIYYRMDNWFRMLALVYQSKSSYEDWEKAVGFKDNQFSWKSRGTFAALKLYLASAKMLIRQAGHVKQFFEHFHESYESFSDFQSIQDQNEKLYLQVVNYQKKMMENWHHTISNDYLAFKYFGLFKKALSNLGIDESQSLANDLVANQFVNSSEQTVLSILNIKKLIESEKVFRELFSQDTDSIAGALLEEKYQNLNQAIEKHIELFGDRMLAELKLENKSFRQDKIGFLVLLQKQLESSTDLKSYQSRKKNILEQAKKRFDQLLGKVNPIKRFYIRWLLKKSAIGIRNRENMRFLRAKGYGLVRLIFYQMASNFKNEGLLEDEKDLFYLTIKELKDLCEGKDKESVPEIIAVRKAQFDIYEETELPDRIIFPPENPPEFGKERKLNQSSNALTGLSVSSGKVYAEVIVIDSPSYELDVKGKILVTRMTDPGWVFLMSQASGIISEKGSLLSHTAIVGRELGLPVVVGVEHATRILKDGQFVTLDATKGIITVDEN